MADDRIVWPTTKRSLVKRRYQAELGDEGAKSNDVQSLSKVQGVSLGLLSMTGDQTMVDSVNWPSSTGEQ